MLKFRVMFYLAALTFAALANSGVNAQQWSNALTTLSPLTVN